ncbi:hypothetical protein HAHI6034_11785 [Hathewaya histolytica]|uniref:Metallo beta-lactamase family protein n=1 Tax=Hathewaya histolytica TaxID=1498 RepID=A0A4U9RCH4_HATHI|nr:hypothetical protein [Hathewaya histolytica]VTQ88886.1 metallo beta-lactamase family protein [Hathewaya histolytica]
MNFLKNKKVSIPVLIILYIILYGISPKVTGILTMLGVGGLLFYLFTKNEAFKAKGKLFKTLTSLGLAAVFLFFGMGGVANDPKLLEQQKLESAKKAQIEAKKKTDEEKAINAAKLKKEEQKKLEEDKKLEEEKKLKEQKKTEKSAEPKTVNNNSKKQDTTNSSNKSSNNTTTVTPTKPKKDTTKNKPQETKPEPKGMVWIPKSGKKYHSKPNCGNMDPKKARQIKLSDAQNKNIQRCSKCF